MADDAVRTLVCLVEGESTIFSVEPKGNAYTMKLKKLIQEEVINIMEQPVLAKDLVLWKVDIQCPSVPNERKGLIGKLIQNAQKLEDEYELISTHWPSTPPFHPNPLHVVVELPSAVGPDVLAKWNYLWVTFWGKPAPECTIERFVLVPDVETLEEAEDTTNYQYLTLPNNDHFPCGLRRILITQTYKILYRKLCDQDAFHTRQSEPHMSPSHSTVITGQPGTGKTAGLSCILVWRLQNKKPTVYCSHERYAYVFSDSGVQPVPLKEGKDIEALNNSIDCCGLVDINPKLPELPSQFYPSPERLGRVVIATSPNPIHVKVVKNNYPMTICTPTWKWADLYCASLLREPIAVDVLRRMYIMLSGIPGRCFSARYSNGEEYEKDVIANAIDQIRDIAEFSQSASGFLPFKNNMSHALVRIEPKDDNWNEYKTDLLSDHVAQLLYDRIGLHDTMQIQNSIFHLLKNPTSRNWGGKLFEIGVHRAFRKGGKFKTVAMDFNAPSLKLEIQTVKSEAHGFFQTLSVREQRGSHKVHKDILNQYLIPLSSTAEAIDAVYISKSVTVLMQITVAPTHNLNYKGINELTKELPADAKQRICILFVVPEHEHNTSETRYKRQKIILPLGLPDDEGHKVNDYNQYVYNFPISKITS